MLKKVLARDLALGMYVARLDRPWEGTPFLFQGFEIRTQEELNLLQELCTFVHIEVEESYSRPAPVRHQPVSPKRPEMEQAARPGEVPAPPLERLLKEPPSGHRYRDETTLEEELGPAKEIEFQAREILFSTLDDVRLGRSINTEGTKKVVQGMVESVIRNPDALVVLSQLKNVDEYTALHSLRVCILSLVFGRHLNLDAEALNLLGVGALLHDVGKMKVPTDILNKPTRLTDEEFRIMKSHVPEGVRILRNSRGIPPLSIEVAERHHERYSGGGYASGMAGDAIGAFGLISAIVDCYDAVTSDRVYHKGMAPLEALSRMYEKRRQDFHPALMEQFIQCMGTFPIGSIVELNTGAIGVVISLNRERRLRPKIVLVLNADKQPCTPPKVLDLNTGQPENTTGSLSVTKVMPGGAYDIKASEILTKYC